MLNGSNQSVNLAKFGADMARISQNWLRYEHGERVAQREGKRNSSARAAA